MWTNFLPGLFSLPFVYHLFFNVSLLECISTLLLLSLAESQGQQHGSMLAALKLSVLHLDTCQFLEDLKQVNLKP